MVCAKNKKKKKEQNGISILSVEFQLKLVLFAQKDYTFNAIRIVREEELQEAPTGRTKADGQGTPESRDSLGWACQQQLSTDTRDHQPIQLISNWSRILARISLDPVHVYKLHSLSSELWALYPIIWSEPYALSFVPYSTASTSGPIPLM